MECLELSRDERGVARVALHRPKVHNAFNQTLIDELSQAFGQLSVDPEVRVVVLEGRGKNFSAGADLEWMQQQAHADDAENRRTALAMSEAFRAIDECAKPVVVKIQGAALGGGSGLTCAADIAVAHPAALFGFTEVRLGILPSVISPFVLRKIGYSQARARFLTGSRFGAEEALRIGMVHYLAENLEEKTLEVVNELLLGAPGAQAVCKRLVGTVFGAEPQKFQQLTVETIATARAGAEGREGVAAFLEKRSPRW